MDRRLWLAMAERLREIADNTVDIVTGEELDEIIDKIYEQFL
ncbi:hypothetical protein D307_gp212 [Bacillus phage Bastille]|uniref:Uncharacterized protein n=3 Tax=Bastillevirus TaxID=1918010 RepID=A0A024B0Z2_9CAUD|nr:hypothetical protein D307_gp212 [Bacillus phage Bastille]YP_009035643.1 hypothetical protein FP76_gp248 [Bacillus phage Evoli]AEQ34252.1 hypothetical protein [Bacillus phage Bastille]AHZ09846.1 hypothetical protein [Bacillus phage Evoli]AMW61875.1 hypothetical protein DNAM5_131 [Bacillus phage Vinny]